MLQPTSDLLDGLNPTRDRLAESTVQLRELAWNIVDYLPLLIVAILIVVISSWIAGRASRASSLTNWLGRNPFSRGIAARLLRGAIVLTGILLALQLLNATSMVGAVLGAAGVAGLALSFAFKDLIENYIAGILLALRQPFCPNDHVEIEGHEGRIARLTTRATILVSLDGNHIRLPNALVFKSVITNFTRRPTRRFEFEIGLGVNEDLLRAQDTAVRTLSAMVSVEKNPSPEATIMTLGDSSVVVAIRGWVDQGRYDFLAVRGAAIVAVKGAFDASGIDMPEPIYRVRLDGPVGALLAPSEPVTRKPPEPFIAVEPEARGAALLADSHIEEMVREEREGSEDMLQGNQPRE